MHDSKRHHRHLGSRTREVTFTREVDYGGVTRCVGDVLMVPVHVADALIRSECAVLSTGSPTGVRVASPPVPPPAPVGDLSAGRSRRRSRRHDGDGG